MIIKNDLINSIQQIPLEKLNLFNKIVKQTKGLIIVLGNGGSNAISSHIAEDYTKILKKKTICFSSSARLTCYANDYGYEIAFQQFVAEFAEKNGLVILISSSGNSKNIINTANYCVKNKLNFIILTGFKKDNKLRKYAKKAKLEYWVNSENYGIVELTHEAFLHSIC